MTSARSREKSPLAEAPKTPRYPRPALTAVGGQSTPPSSGRSTPPRSGRSTAKDGQISPKVAHDLRTPLGSLLMWIRMLRSGDVEGPAAFAAVEESARQLSAVIDRLAAPRTEPAAKAAVPPVDADLASMVEAAVLSLRGGGRAPDVRLERVAPHGPLGVAGDAALAAETVRALLQFAANACPDGVTLVIRLEHRPPSAYVVARAARGDEEDAALVTVSFPLVPR